MDNDVCEPVETPGGGAAHRRLRRIAVLVILVATVGCGVPMGIDGRTALDGTCSKGRPEELTADDLLGTWRLKDDQTKDVRKMLVNARPAPFELRPKGKLVVTVESGKKLTGTWEVTEDVGHGHDLELDVTPDHRDAPHHRLWVIRHQKKFFIYNLIGDPDACHVVWYARQAK